jgi:hypothetical protein
LKYKYNSIYLFSKITFEAKFNGQTEAEPSIRRFTKSPEITTDLANENTD